VRAVVAQATQPSIPGSGAFHYLPAVFALLVAAAGWYYLFYSPAAVRLGGIETDPANQKRIRLRRINGIVMMLLAVAFYAVGYTVSEPQPFLLLLVSIILLLAVMMYLALADLRLTAKLRRNRRQLPINTDKHS
jgi:hypothetical protein